MNSKIRTLLASVTVLLAMQVVAWANIQQVQLQFLYVLGGGGNLNPYEMWVKEAGSTETATPALSCDDHVGTVWSGIPAWNAWRFQLSDLVAPNNPPASIPKFHVAQIAGYTIMQEYFAAAILANTIYTRWAANQATWPGSADAVNYSYALWGIFAPDVLGTGSSAAKTLRDTTLASIVDGISVPNVTIYTPFTADSARQEFIGPSIGCTTGDCTVEFHVPEASALGLLSLNLLGLLGVGVIFGRKRSA